MSTRGRWPSRSKMTPLRMLGMLPGALRALRPSASTAASIPKAAGNTMTWVDAVFKHLSFHLSPHLSTPAMTPNKDITRINEEPAPMKSSHPPNYLITVNLFGSFCSNKTKKSLRIPQFYRKIKVHW